MRQIHFYFLVVLLILLQPSISQSQYQNVKINPAGKYFFGEEYIKINPKNTNQIVAGIMASYSPLTTIMGYCYSSNSGLTWGSGPITCSFAQPGSDPVIAVDTNGIFYYICCANWQVPGPNLDQLLIFKSTNGGANWDGGTGFAYNAPGMDDMPMAWIDRSHSSPYGNYIYVTMSLYDSLGSMHPTDSCRVVICHSSDGGVTFTPTVNVSKVAGTARCDNSSPEGISPCTGENGEVYVVWPLNEKVYFNRSTNAGVTWLENDIFVCTQPGGWMGGWPYNWSPVVACDISNSPYRGTVYICFVDYRNGANDKDVWLVKSTNKGNTWSGLKRVNNDGAGNMQFLPWICVDDVTGYVWVVFYDTRGNTTSLANAYVARSTDGGNTFQNSKISTTPMYTGYWFGDYISIDAYNNKVRPLWTKPLQSNMAEIYSTIIDTFYSIGINQISKEVPAEFSLGQNYPNPFNQSTIINFQCSVKGKVTLKVYDVTGREVATLVNEVLEAGSYQIRYDVPSTISSGIYFYKMTVEDPSRRTDNYIETKRMILLK